MPARIKKTWTALLRHFRLETSPDPFQLDSIVIPVTVVHVHLEDRARSLSHSASNAGNTQTLQGFEAGTYRITWNVTMAFVLAGTVVQTLAVRNAAQNATRLTLGNVVTGAIAGDSAFYGDWTIGLEEGEELVSILSGAGVGNNTYATLVVQAL